MSDEKEDVEEFGLRERPSDEVIVVDEVFLEAQQFLEAWQESSFPRVTAKPVDLKDWNRVPSSRK